MSFIKNLALVFRKIYCWKIDFHCLSIPLLTILLFHFSLIFVSSVCFSLVFDFHTSIGI